MEETRTARGFSFCQVRGVFTMGREEEGLGCVRVPCHLQ
jgi:hypothetical protein